MKVIINENQMGKVLKNSIKETGVEFTANLVGGVDNLFDTLNIEYPMDFLHLFDDLTQVRSEERPSYILFRYKPKVNFMVYHTESEYVYINYYEIWSFLEDQFGLNYSETQELTKTWLDEVYNLRGVMTGYLFSQEMVMSG